MKVKKETLFPKTKIQWLWENMKGRRVLYVIGMLGTVVYNILQLTVPYYSGRIVDLFLSGADAWKNMRTNSGLFYHLLILMIVFTVLRGVIDLWRLHDLRAGVTDGTVPCAQFFV